MSEVAYEGIAIVGFAGRFPGAASVAEFWANLVAGRETVSHFTDAELTASGLDVSALRRHGRYVAARGVLAGAEMFDAAFFGVHPKEAEVMDPQQRLFLETCWTALEHAGYAPNLIEMMVGVFGGATYNTYYLHELHARPELREMVGADMVMFGNERDYLATRVAYKLGLRGPAVSVSTACSTSLVAVCQASTALLMHHCDMALAGGVSVTVPQQRGYFHDEGNIGSADGHTRTFDVRATGTVFSNGVGAVVLKRLEDAVRDGDSIYAVIKGAALNNDGSSRVSFGAPGVEGQADAIATAHAIAGIEPASISYVEAHGTATPLGDPIEVAALTKAFRLGTDARQFCALGSVKTNIGHLDVAAGVAGLIKTTLALHHRVLPASLHFEQPNPKLQLESSPFFVNAELRAWDHRSDSPRRAGVSSFGSGGTNAHVVVEQAPDLPPSGPSRPFQLLAVSAKTVAALDAVTDRLAVHLRDLSTSGREECRARLLADSAYTLQQGRSHFAERRVMVCSDAADGAEQLERRDARRVFTNQTRTSPRVAFMFPGQGAQYAGMGAELYRSERIFRDEIDRSAEILAPLLDVDLRALLFERPGTEEQSEYLLTQTRYTQPALFAVEYALARLWMSWGITPVAMIGHSVGEYVAGCLAGVFTLDAALTLVARRGAMVQELPGGAMLAVRLPERDVLPLLVPDVAIAAVNAPELCIVAGPLQSIDALEQTLVAREVGIRRLRTSHAFHSSMMDPVIGPFAELVRGVSLGVPTIPYLSNVLADWITDAQTTSPEYWAAHVRQPVRFGDGLAALIRRHPDAVLLEVGPGHTLTSLARQQATPGGSQIALASMPFDGTDEPRGLLEALGRVWAAGVTVDWRSFSAHERRSRVALPTYPFERKRFWPESQTVEATSTVPAPVRAATRDEGDLSPSDALSAFVAETPDPCVPVERRGRLQVAVRELISELSGYDLTAVDGSIGLLELGLDSLLLTQLSQLVQRRFAVSMTFRQLMEDVDSIDALAAYLDATLPPDAAPPPVVEPSPALLTARPGGEVTSSQTAALEQLLRQQVQLTNQVLAMLGRAPTSTGPTPVRPAVVPRATSPSAASPRATSGDRATAAKGHGPFRPHDRTSATLSLVQRRGLDDLIARYGARTAASKRLAAQHRAGLADPRSASGFKALWKEMVYPIVTTRSEGSRVYDADGHEYIDFVMGFGASLFGHRPPFVVSAIQDQLSRGFEIGPIQPIAGEVASLVREFTGLDRVAFTNTGSEAVLAATRLARTVTGRDKIAIFAGAYHGIFDEVLSRAVITSGELRTLPIAPGIPDSAVSQVIVLEYGKAESLDLLRERGHELAAILVEPVQSRRLELQPAAFLQELRRAADETGAALIFDEVVTGFRVHPGGAQAYFDVRADLASYGKVVGGGLPIGIVAGSPRFMDALDGGRWQYGDSSTPEVGVTFFAGTFVRHPLALAAAKAVLTHLREQGPGLQRALTARAARLAADLTAIVSDFGAPFAVAQFSSLLQITFPPEERLAGLLFYLLRERGIHCWENRAFVLTTAHSDEDLERFVQAFRSSLAEMRASRFFGADDPFGEPTDSDDSKPHIVPFTDAQLEVWLASQMSVAASASFNESVALELTGPVNVPALEDALAGVVSRHEALRMTVVSEPPGFKMGHARVSLFVRDFTSAADPDTELAHAAASEYTRPFDLEQGPLLRASLLVMPQGRQVLLLTAHHLVCDGWSFGIVVRELAALYSSGVTKAAPVLAAPLQASRFASDWHTAQQSGLADADEAYWLGQYKTIPDPIELPSDRPRPAAKGYHGARVSRRIDAAAATRIKAFAARQRATLFATLLAAFETLVHRLTGQQDFAIGIPIAGQSLLNGEDLVAHCVSFVPLRSTIDPEHSFAEHLAAVKQRTLAMNEHRSVTMGRLLNCLRIKRDVSRYTLVSVSFTLERAVENLEFHGLDARLLELPRAGSKRDLELNLVEGADGITIAADLDTDLYDPASVERWLESYLCLLEHAIEDPTTPLARLPMVSAGERRLLESWNATAREWPESERTIDELIARVTAAGPARVAVVAEGGTLTYRALNARANQLARHLRCIGTRPGDIVGLAVERSFDMVVGVLGILKAGAAYLPLDPAFPEKRLEYMLADSGAQVLITHRDLARKFATAPTIVPLDADAAAIASQSESDLEPSAGGPARLAYVLYTSGSTGRPKGVAISHGALRNLLESVRVTPGFTAADTMLAVTTLSFDIAGLEVFLPLLCGGRLVVADRSQIHSPDDLIALIETSRCTVMQATPTLWRTLIEAGWSGTPELRVLCGGEQLPGDLAAQLLRRCGELWNMYGPTETTIYSTGRRITNAETVDIGRPLPNTDVWVLDSRRELAPIGVEGELCIGGAGLAQGYVGQPGLTEERFVPHPFKPGARLYRTGDRARWLIGGSLQCLGRLDTQVKLRGFRIELGEIEAALRQVPCVQDAVVLRREDSPGDARLVGYVIGSATPEAIRAHLTQVLPDYAVPAVFVGVEAWPLTPNGKIDRKALPAPAANRRAHQENFVAPRTPTEERLAALWRRVLGIEQIGLSDDFFLLGGHSLLAMQVVHNVHREFGFALAPAALFQHSTLEALARHIERGGAESRTAVDDNVLVQLHRGGRGAPFFWVHGIGGGVFGYLNLSEHLGRSRPVYGFAADWTRLAGEVEPTVEAMAARYVRDMRAVQPTGPYHLGGFCSGAILALEMARQLEAAGEHVGVLAALDSVIEPQRQPDSWLRSTLQTSIAFARNLPRWVMEDALIAGPVELIGRMRSHLRLIAATRRTRGGVAATDDVRDALGMWRFPDHQARMLKVHHDAMQRYVPRPIAGTVCVFLPRTAPLLRPALPAPAATGWEKLARGAFEVRVVQGSHATMMVEPFATSLGQLLDACVAQCERQPVPAAESPNRVTRAASIVQALTGALIAAFM